MGSINDEFQKFQDCMESQNSGNNIRESLPASLLLKIFLHGFSRSVFYYKTILFSHLLLGPSRFCFAEEAKQNLDGCQPS